MNHRSSCSAFLSLLLLASASAPALADRAPVLRQIDVPHDYYFREMYLPQLTSGPSALSWSPDGRALVYSMQGSLWRQSLESNTAEQLTAGPGYDYQPDWSPDGKRLVFVRYHNDALELHSLDIASGTTTPLTEGGHVNLEPRWSPDGSRIAFVSTRDTGRFHVFTGELGNGALQATQLVPERKSAIERYYYSAYDHELSPSWAADGKSLLYVANPEIPYGTGAIWRKSLEGDSEPVLVRKEETTWKARPDWAPDGKRIVYSSYLGRQWHQLWLTHIDNLAEPFPLTYGSFDVTAARWSPDGKRIAYIANENGNLEIRVQDFVGGKVSKLRADERSYLQPMATLDLSVIGSNDLPLAARVAIVAADGRNYAPDSAWIHADDSFDRDKSKREAQYFHIDGKARITLPPGTANVIVWRGPEFEIAQHKIKVQADHANALSITMQRLPLPAAWNAQVGGDVHVHMNYGGTYRATPQSLIAQAAAEDLDVVFNLLVNKEQRVPDIAYFSAQADEASTRNTLLLHSQENHTSFWGHLGILGLKSHLLVPDYSAYPYTGAASLFPDNTTVATLAREQGATIGYVHPFLSPPPDPAKDAKLTNALPIDAALGLVDYYEVIGFADHRASAEVWYGLLNCGMRIAAAGGTDAMSNYASLRGPVGINRTYVPLADVPTDPEQRRDNWLAGLKAGKSLATNGPLLGLTVEGYGPGAEIARGTGEHELKYAGYLRSAVPVDHLELVHNGKVVKSFKLDRARRSADINGTVTVEGSGWLLLRAWNDNADPLIFDLYPYASTSPVYVTVNEERPRSARDADYFLAWIGRVREGVMAHAAYNDDSERTTILAHLEDAERVYQACR